MRARRYRAFGDAPVLSQGDSGTAVVTLQTDLNSLGYGPLTVDGQFGDATYQALITFQNASGLTMSGQADQATWDALAATPLAQPTPTTNDPYSLTNMIGNAGYGPGTGGSGPVSAGGSVPKSSSSSAPLALAGSTPATTSPDWKLYGAIGALSLGGLIIIYSLVRRT